MAEPDVDGRTRRATEQRESRRAAILDAALEAFGTRGYHQTHVSDILSLAGIARGTFYLYFDGKSAVFLELLEGLLAELGDSIVGVETGPGSPPVEAQLADTVRRILATVSNNRLLTAVVVREAVGLDAEVDARLSAFYGRLLAYIREALIEGQRIGFVRALDVEVAAMCILGTIKQFMEHLVRLDDDATVDVRRMALAVLDFNLRGLTTHQPA
ncbi:MAG: TetR/AcrR family transcriptional regulator [Myxococcales bacterium]|nr:TetR/AcrR family transcriptional regulator [Myxococcales bacterium]